MAVSGDTIVASAYLDDVGLNTNQGSAYVFVRPAGGWTDATQTAKLTAGDGAADDWLGWSVAVSGDTIVAGAVTDDVGLNTNQGSAYVFVRPAGGWANASQTAKLTAADDDDGAAQLGYSVAVSGDTIVAGAPVDDVAANIQQGSAYVFVRPAGGWANATQTAKLTAADGATSDVLGRSVAVSGDTIVAGALGDDGVAGSNQGSVYVFVRPAGGWATVTQTAKLTAADGAADDVLGWSVAVSGDTIVAGSASDDGVAGSAQGSVYVFVRPAGGWVNTTQTAKLTASDGAANDVLGRVAVSGDTIVAGAPLNVVPNSDHGSAYVFVSDDDPPLVSCASADAQWHAANVSIACTATDTGSGLATASQASFALQTGVEAGSQDANASTGSVEVCDAVGNCATAGPVTGNKIDRKQPDVACDTADGQWHAANVSIACTATDTGSGLANASQASFALQTSVAAGSEDANASTGSVEVCDAVGNCATAGPVTGNKIDRKQPTITLTTPADGANYAVIGPAVVVSYACSDAGSGVASCTGTQPDGSTLPTGLFALGTHTFTVTATDNVGNVTTVTHTYRVTLLGLGLGPL